MSNKISIAKLVHDRRGIALPMALLGMIMVSVIVTGVLVSSATEAALSTAHQEATTSLYTAEGALSAYLGEVGLGIAPAVELGWVPAGGGLPVDIAVTLLSVEPIPSLPPRETFAVRAEPSAGGRAVMAMVTRGPFELAVESAATFGGDSKIGGSTIVSDGRDSESCDLAQAENAIVHGDGTAVDTTGNHVAIIGDVKESDKSGADLVRETLGGYSIEELLSLLHGQNPPASQFVRFGTNAIWGTQSNFTGTGNNKPKSWYKSGNAYYAKLASDAYNWYCPGKIDDSTPACWTIPTAQTADTSSYKVIAIDAGGSEVTIQGDHGQGMIAVVNGGIRISGGFIFRGLIVSTHDIDITGTGNKVEGAIVSQNEVRVDRPSDSDSEVLGNAVVRFNRCALQAVANVINPGGPGGLLLRRTFGWSEIVR